MAGGGGSGQNLGNTQTTTANQAAYDAAHQADRYVPTADTYQPAPTIPAAATRPVTPVFTPAPFSQQAQYDLPQGYGQSTLAQYFQNLPSYQQPGGSTRNTAFASDLAARTKAQIGTQDAALKAAEALRVQQSADALKAYQVQRANEEWQAKLAAANKQIADLQAAQPSWGWGASDAPGSEYQPHPGGASGGLASLQGFER